MDLSKHEIKITDMKAFKVGNAQNLEAATGCTAITLYATSSACRSRACVDGLQLT